MSKYALLFRTSFIGTVITAICCFTPALVILFSAVGLSALVVYLDFILIPTLVFFIVLTAVTFFMLRRSKIREFNNLHD